MIDLSISCMWIPVKLEIFIRGFKFFKIFQYLQFTTSQNKHKIRQIYHKLCTQKIPPKRKIKVKTIKKKHVVFVNVRYKYAQKLHRELRIKNIVHLSMPNEILPVWSDIKSGQINGTKG